MKKAECPVVFTHDIFGTGNSVLADEIKKAAAAESPRVLIVADANFVQRNRNVGLSIGSYIQRYGLELAGQPVVFGGGERLKTDGFGSVMAVATAAIKARLSDGGVMLMIGGGSVFDAAGVAAALANGGIRTVRVPTTPAAMIGAAYAKYSAIDAAGVKDSIRVPSVAAAVVIDPGLAATVLDGVWNGGFGEAVRVAAVSDSKLVKRLAECAAKYRQRDVSLLEEIVRAVSEVRRKKEIAPFAEWIARRLEAMSCWKLPHGYAVPMGIAVECAYAEAKGCLKPADRAVVTKALADSGASEGSAQSKAFLEFADGVLQGLDEWRMLEGTGEVPCIIGLGKCRSEVPDVSVYRQVMAPGAI